MITTPTLSGRWQTRLITLISCGIPLSFIFTLIFNFPTDVYAILLYWLVMGFGLDIFYNYLQKFRWDHDWPPLYAMLSGIVEWILLWLIIDAHLPGIASDYSVWQLIFFYLLISFLGLFVSTVIFPVLFPDRRFHGGEWW